MAALIPVQQNIATEIQTLAQDILVIKNRLAISVAMFGAEGMASLADADLQALPEFAHVTVQELTAAKNALDAINTAVGEYVAGTNATKLMRVVLRVPK
jgi:hypothetical protein